jgi:hypothetical protein
VDKNFWNKRRSLLCPDKDTGLGLVCHDKVVASPSLPESLEERSVVTDVLLAKHGLDGTSGFLGMVERNATIGTVSFSAFSEMVGIIKLTGRDGEQRGTR